MGVAGVQIVLLGGIRPFLKQLRKIDGYQGKHDHIHRQLPSRSHNGGHGDHKAPDIPINMQKILAVFFRDNLRVHSELRKPLGAVGFQELLNMLPEEAAEILQTQLSGTRRFDLQPLHIFQISGQHVRKDQRGRPDGSAGKSGQVAGQPGVNDGLQRHGEPQC